MADLKPAYLIFGEDHGAVAERRARLRALASGGAQEQTIESFEGTRCTPEAVAEALSRMSIFATRRVILADGVERWKDAAVKQSMVGALAAIPPLTTIAMFGFEEGRTKVSELLARAVQQAGGQVVREAKPRPWELPGWTVARAAMMGMELDEEAAGVIVAQAAGRRQRITRELEKLEVQAGAKAGETRRIGAEELQSRLMPSPEAQAFALADAILHGQVAEAVGVFERLSAQGERWSGLSYLVTMRLRQALDVARQLAQGHAPATVRRSLRMPQKAAESLIADARRTGSARIQQALCLMAELEALTRGSRGRAGSGALAQGLAEETQALGAIIEIARLCA